MPCGTRAECNTHRRCADRPPVAGISRGAGPRSQSLTHSGVPRAPERIEKTCMQKSTPAQRPSSGLSLTDPRVRAWVFQIIAVLVVLASGWFLFENTQTNLAHRGIQSGFGFLSNTAGFGISQHLIAYTEADTYARV